MQTVQYSADYYRRSLSRLETALAEVAAYRGWRALDPGPGCPVDTRYAAMPALTKKDIRGNFPQGLLPADRDVSSGLATGEIQLVKTSGSSDVSVTNIWNQQWWDASERASWQLNSYASKLATGSHHEAILVNPLNVGFISDTAELPLEKRRLARFLYLNEKTDILSWSPAHMDRMISELEIFQPAVLEANPSLLARLCRYAAAGNKKVYQPGLIVLTYEYPTQLHRRQISRVFDVPIASSYGTTETGYVFMQCEAGRLHQNSDFCRVDFRPLQGEHGGPRLGQILVTPFDNPWYYLLRFDVGDLARLDAEGECPCGRNSGLILSAIEGRVANLTLTCQGRPVTLGELDAVVSGLQGIDEYRLDQLTGDTYHLYLVSQRPDKERLSAEAVELLRGIYGREANVNVTYHEALAPESSGKYRISRTAFPVELENYLAKTAAGGMECCEVTHDR
jgi:phenylacetate-coenzyme A ligase PaaK-like adenylate-forming protein